MLEWSTQLYDEGAASYKAGTALGPVSPHPLVVETLACRPPQLVADLRPCPLTRPIPPLPPRRTWTMRFKTRSRLLRLTPTEQHLR